MKLTDLNRDGGIGANSLFVQLGDLNILVDCGLNPKKVGRAATPDLSKLRGVTLDLIIITHCHLDHIGSLPVVMREIHDVQQRLAPRFDPENRMPRRVSGRGFHRHHAAEKLRARLDGLGDALECLEVGAHAFDHAGQLLFVPARL
mgnify:CR=1 FL=1